ncbi:MAG: phosphoglycerate dehydrogenase [Desulfobacterales bacterium]|nr:phosphoglycerate dehydrogenase [Desulfobacterales bacterium]
MFKSKSPKRVWSLSPSFGHTPTPALDYLADKGCEVALYPAGERPVMDAVLKEIDRYDALVPGLFPITAEVVNAAKKLKVISMAGAGFSHIDLEAAARKGIMVTNAPGTNHHAVAELAIGFVFALARDIAGANHAVKSGQWPKFVGSQIRGKTLGVLGTGLIGKEVALRGLGLGMSVVAHDLFEDTAFAKAHGISYLPLDQVLACSDFLSIHMPLTPETRGIIGADALSAMKPSACLINLSRGSVVDETALCRALKDKEIAGAALDVFENEPPGDNPLLGLDNLLATPHMGGYTREALESVTMICAENIVNALEGRTPDHLLNQDLLGDAKWKNI